MVRNQLYQEGEKLNNNDNDKSEQKKENAIER